MLPPENLRPGELVAVPAPPGPDWIHVISDVWDGGAAVLPLDHRLPEPERRDIIRRARPARVLDGDEWERLEGAKPADGVALVMHTSGTGGVHKLVELDRAAVDAAVASSAGALSVTANDPWLCCLPLAHVGGLLVLLRAVLLGAPVVVHEEFDARAVAQVDARFTSLVPTMLERLLDLGVDLDRFRTILIGGAALPPDRRARALDARGTVVETYGLTETCGGVVYDGRPLERIEIRIGDAGIELRGPTLMRGYRLDPKRTAAAFSADGWLRTGDAGEIDASGVLQVSGRLDDLINSGGEKVWPHEVETALATHGGVQDVAIVGAPDPEWGQRVVAFVVPRDRARPPTLEELRDHVSATIARFKAPHELVLVDSLPRTPSGKVSRIALRVTTN